MRLTQIIYQIGIFFLLISTASAQSRKKLRQPEIILNGGLPAPECTLPAIDLAIQQQFSWLRLPVQLTRDGHHVVLEDSVLARFVPDPKPVSAFTLAELQALDAGSGFAPRFAGLKILTLPEVLQHCRDQINLLLECRQVVPELLVAEISHNKMTEQVILTAPPEIRPAILRCLNAPALAVRFREMPKADLRTKNPIPGVVLISFDSADSKLTAKLSATQSKIWIDCTGAADLPANWRQMLPLPIDGLLTDKGDELLAEMLKQSTKIRKPVLISAHRGVLALAPENTLAAYQKAIDLGLDYIEIDVRPTRDTVFVSVHDGSLKRTTGLDRPVSALTLAEIRQLSAGKFFGQSFENEKVPTLAEIFQLGRGKIKFYLDFKAGDPAQLVGMMREWQVVDDCVIYGAPDQLLTIRQLEPRAKIMPPLNDAAQIPVLAAYQPYAFDTAWRSLSPELIQSCHALGIRVFSDAMGGHENIPDFLEAIRWGIDCIQTDEPLLLLRAVQKYLAESKH